MYAVNVDMVGKVHKIVLFLWKSENVGQIEMDADTVNTYLILSMYK